MVTEVTMAGGLNMLHQILKTIKNSCNVRTDQSQGTS